MRPFTVTELPLRLEPLSRDPFIDDVGVAAPVERPVVDATVKPEPFSTPTPPVSTLVSASRASRPAARASAAPSDSGAQVAALVRAAAAGSDVAWTQLVRRFDRPLRSIARSSGLSPADVDDVMQETWIRLFRHIGGLRDPAAVRTWLTTCTRRECMRVLQRRLREELTDDPDPGERVAPDCPQAAVLATERRVLLARALSKLPARHRSLMTLLAAEPAPEYQEIGAMLAMPVGSIGPIRARCLARLERSSELSALRDAA